MQFDSSSAPVPNQLLSLRNRLFHRHLLISLPCLIALVLIFHLSSFLTQYPKIQSSQLQIPALYAQYFDELFLYAQHCSQIADDVYQMKLGNASGSLENERVQGKNHKIGMYCLNVSDSNDGCAKFVGVARVSWQYQNFNALVCSKQQKQCISTEQYSLKQSQIQTLLSQFSQFGCTLQLSSNLISPYSIFCTTPSLFLMFQIQNPFVTHSSFLSNMDFSYSKYYKMQIKYPIKLTLYEYGSITNANDVQSMTYEVGTDPRMRVEMQVEAQRNTQHIQHAAIFSGLVSLLYIVLIFKYEYRIITEWCLSNFSRKHLINRLYRYTIRDIFTGQKPNSSNILQQGPSSQLFLILSSLIDKNLVSIQLEKGKIVHKQPFKFISTFKSMYEGYRDMIVPLMEAKNRYILTNRFNLQTSINDLFEQQQKTIKENFVRGQQLGIECQMFKFAYMAILRSQQEFTQFLQSDSSPMPKKLCLLFLSINTTIHNPSTISQKLLQQEQMALTVEEQNYIQENKQELQLRIRVYVIPKYLGLFKELDARYGFVDKLGYQRELRSLAEIIENTRFMLTRHNKTIRQFSK